MNTPSSASTSSLAQLHEKLAALPHYKYDKEPVSVCAQPALSSVTELSERDDRSIATATTLQYKSYGIAQRRIETSKSRSYTEVQQRIERPKSQSDTEATKRPFTRNISPVVSDNDVSLLLVTTIGSSDDAVINETIERLSKKKDFDRREIVDMLVKEALQERDKATDSGINTDDNKKSQEIEENSEAIEGTPVLANEKVKKTKLAKKKVCTIVSKSTTDDESNTEAVNDSTFVTSRSRKDKPEPNTNIFDVNTVENFFSQHYTANREGDVVISPSLAKKINETSSESSYHFDDCLVMDDNYKPDEVFQFNDIDIIECLNDVVDKVCHEFEKCSEYFREKTPDKICPNKLTVTPKRSNKSPVVTNSKSAKTKTQSKPKAEIKIKFKSSPEKQNSKRVIAKKTKKTKQISPKKMSIIAEQPDEEEPFVRNEVPDKLNTPVVVQNTTNTKDTPSLQRRKRKLYSPKDNEIQVEKNAKVATSDTDDDAVLSDFKTKKNTPKTTVYKEIENERKKRIRSKPRITKGKVQEPPSPRTLKMNETFDKLKETVEGTEKITLADKTNMQTEVYNFSSGSDDEDFIKKKNKIQKRISSTTVTSNNSKTSNRANRNKTRVNYSESKSSNDEAKKPKRKPPTKRAKRNAIKVERVDLIDEKMREAKDTIDTSIVIENKPQKESPTVDLVLKDCPQMEPISDTEEPIKVKPLRKTTKKAEIVSIKKEKNKKDVIKQVSEKEDYRSVASTSPLPGLVVEISRKDDPNDSLTANMAQKFKKIYQDGPDQNESNITQNMLSDIERNNSQQNIELSVTDEIRNLQEETNKPSKMRVKYEFKKSKDKELNEEIIEITDTKTKLHDENRTSHELKEISEQIIDLSKDKVFYNSSVSIATDGINAHNDLEAAPPSTQTIEENYRPREIEDLDIPTREYFERLTKAINDKDISASDIVNSIEKSPIVSVKKLSIEDINKYLPSPKSSTIGSNNHLIVEKLTLNKIDIQQFEKSDSRTNESPTKTPNKSAKDVASIKSSETDSRKAKSIVTSEKSPKVNIARISLKEFDKWLPPLPEIVPSKTGDTKSKKKSKETLQLIKSNKDKQKCPSTSNSSQKSTKIRNRNITKDKPKTILTRSVTRKLDAITKLPAPTRKSNIISPIRSFEEFVSNLKPNESDNESTVIRKVNTPKFKDVDDSDDEITKIPKVAKPQTLLSKPVPISVTSMKRMSSPIRVSSEEIKKPKYDNVVTISESGPSGPSATSVHEWLKRTEASIKGDTSRSSEDAIRHILEKLDTTLNELNHITNKKFVNLFVDTQAQLIHQQEERRLMCENAKKEIINMFDDLNRKSREMDTKFMNNLKEQAFELLKQDCKQKRAMLALLKEDVQSALDNS